MRISDWSSRRVLFRSNINDGVRVRLTGYGRKALQRECAALSIPYEAPDEDAEGCSQWQLWDLMSRLGAAIIFGGPQPFHAMVKLALPDPFAPRPLASAPRDGTKF